MSWSLDCTALGGRCGPDGNCLVGTRPCGGSIDAQCDGGAMVLYAYGATTRVDCRALGFRAYGASLGGACIP